MSDFSVMLNMYVNDAIDENDAVAQFGQRVVGDGINNLVLEVTNIETDETSYVLDYEIMDRDTLDQRYQEMQASRLVSNSDVQSE